jgi:RHS repeat-associated protein
VGNRLSSLGVSSYSNNTSNELTSTSNASYTYDNNGNTLTKVVGSNTTSYAWDFENRLTSVTLPGTSGTVSFKYDPFDRRIYKSSTSGLSVFAYDGNNLIEETNSSGTVVARYQQGLNIDEPLALLRSGSTSFYHADGLGSVTSLSNGVGSLAQTYAYDSFGKQTNSSGSLTNPFQYTGREVDTDTGLYFYRARYMDTVTGRFLNEDPVGFDGGMNLYAYAENNSTDFIDPFGWSPAGKDKWYGHNDPDFHKWFHRCWKQAGDPDADKAQIQEAFGEWVRRGKPQGGKCGSPPPGSGCKQQKTNFEIDKDIESDQYKVKFYWDIVIGDAVLGIVGTAGAFGVFGGAAAGGAGEGGGAIPFPKPAPAPPAVPLRPAA